MRRKIGVLVIIILLLNLLSGCWNRRELNELAITVGLAIDKSEDQYVLTAQVVIPGAVAATRAAGQKLPVITYTEKGTTVFEAARRMTTISPRKIYFPHLRILVIGEELAEDGIGEVLDFLSRDHELRTDFYVAVAKDMKAENALKVLPALEDIPASKLFTSLETSEKAWAPTVAVTLDELISELVSEGMQPSLSGIQIRGDVQEGEKLNNVQQIDPDVDLQYSELAVFKGEKLIGWLNESESKAVNYVLGNVKSTIGEVPCPEGKGDVAIEVIRTKTDLKAKVENGSPKGIVEIKIEGNVGDVQCKKLDLTKTKTIDDLEKKSNKDVKKLVESSIKSVQEEFKVDVFGFGEAIHRSNPDYWKKVKKEWDEKFADMPVEVKADVQIRRIGKIGNSPNEKIKE
ncbi:Ger(x)C family spore germination protein [Metabacillus bambusae]|uniref:Ger(X)C family spore germination protein n=1 Tax=Metabacillus bambusae TaxID=2795218 RepID=A0ABS3NBL4_9BACI|nr:Ger(x)C family spore germination protein [Metabacillus bambusae]MBO1515440.1 Ger(x)C family spore germination protein [Metabacillus bambusae]